MLHLVCVRVVEIDLRCTRVGKARKIRKGGAVMLSFGIRGWLMDYRNRLWTMSEWEGKPMEYSNNWPWTAKCIMLYCDRERELISGRVFEKLRHHEWLDLCRMHDATFRLILLQRWFRECNARRRARRLALAMALHPRLGSDCWLSTVDTDLARALILAAT
jgi:hypothetical protein